MQANRLKERDSFKKQTKEHTARHEHQQRAKKRINAANDFINRQQRRDDVIHEDNADPSQHQIIVLRIAFHDRIAGAFQNLLGNTGQKSGGAGNEYYTNQHQQN